MAGGEVAVIVADEAVLALTGYRLADPLAVFYPGREPGVSDSYLREHVLLGRLEDLDLSETVVAEAPTLQMAAAPPPAAAPGGMGMTRGKAMAPQGMAMDAFQALEEAPATPIRARTDFSALALFAASLPTDARGHAEVALKVPDNLTRYRVMAVGVAGGKQFGAGESSVQARLPLMVRPSPPRFLNFGDRFELGVVLQNQTDAPLDVQVAVRATNAELTAGAGRRLTVPAGDRVEVRFPAAAQRAGTARFQVGVAAGRFADAAEFSFPVWTPATTEAFATYGTLDQGAVVQPVQAPPNVVPQFGGLEVTTSSTALQSLTDAVLYLVAYPFECSEQLASRILAVAALKDVLTAFKAEGLPPRDELLAAVDRDLARLRAMQNADGGFGFWRRGDEPWPYLGVHVANAYERARAKGFKVPDDTWSRSQSYLKDIEKHIPGWYGEEARRTLIAYALAVRQRMGDPDPGRARKLVAAAGVDKLSFEALGWLLPVLSADKASAAEATAIRRHLANRVEETAGAAHFVVSYGDSAHLLLHSDRRADAVLLEALIATDPQNDLIPKLVAGLLGHRQAGRWGNTQENVFVLLALDRYFGAYEKSHARLRGTPVAGRALRGRAGLPRPLDRPSPADGADGRAGQQGHGAAAADLEGRSRPALLPHRPALRAVEPEARPGRPRVHGHAPLRGRRREGRRQARRRRHLAREGWRARAREARAGGSGTALPRRAGRPAAGRPRTAQPGAGHDRHAAEGRGHRRGRDGRARHRRPGPPRPVLVVVVAPVVRAPEPARRARRGLQLAGVGGRVQLQLRGARDHAGHIRGAARQGRGDVRARDVRPDGHGSRGRGVASPFTRWAAGRGEPHPLR